MSEEEPKGAKKIQQRIRLLIFGIICVVVFLVTNYTGNKEISDIKTHQGQVVGKIYRVESGHRADWNVYYKYCVGDKTFNDMTEILNGSPRMTGQPLMVVYSTVHPENNRALLYPDEYKRFGLEMPESLNRVYKNEH